MTRPKIGSIVIDTSRRELGEGIVQGWRHFPRLGRCARVSFDTGPQFVQVDNLGYRNYRNAGRKPTTQLKAAIFGLTAQQYREAMKA